LATPFILSISVLVNLFDPMETKRIWTVLGLIGGLIFMAGAILYQDWGLITIECCFLVLNSVGFVDSWFNLGIQKRFQAWVKMKTSRSASPSA
jgi:hypothetical protein